MTVVRTLSLDQFIAQLGKLPDELEGAIVRGLQSAAIRGAAVVVEKINSYNPETGTPPAVDEGTLARSVGVELRARGASIVVDAPHAPYLELGTRPHWAPLQPLFDWAKRKFQVEDGEAWAIARAVQVKIARFGTAPRFFMARAMQEIEHKIVFQEIERELIALR